MPRTLAAPLLAAMNSGNFTPWFKVQVLDSDRVTVLYETTEVTGFQMDGLHAIVEFHDDSYYTLGSSFRVLRGINDAGTLRYITSSHYFPYFDRNLHGVRTLEGHVFPRDYYSTPGDVTYHDLIDTVCTHFNLGVTWADPAAAWLNYQFYPAGRTLVLNNAHEFFTILRQKYLIFATDYDDDNLYFFHAVIPYPAQQLVQATKVLFPGVGAYKEMTFLSRDEFMTTHYGGGTNKPLHNLGYLELADSQPARYYYTDTNDWILQGIPPNLKYLDFDYLFASMSGYFSVHVWPAKVREIFDKKLTPSWQFQSRYLDIFGTTEGGTLPSTIEAAAPYTPLKTGYFNKTLSAADNNLQAAMETLDNHVHQGAAALDANDIPLTTGNFTLVLSGADSDVQTAMDTIDNHDHGAPWLPLTGGTLTDTLEINTTSCTEALWIRGTVDTATGYGIRMESVFTGTTQNMGLRFAPTQTSIATSGFYGIDARPHFNNTAAGTQVSFFGLLGIPIIDASTNANVTSVYAGYFRLDNNSTVSCVVTNYYGVYIADATTTGATGVITNSYGLYIANMNSGGTLNYAIYTGSNASRFGGTILAAGDTGGLASTIGLTNVSSSTISTGVGSVKMSGTTARTNTDWIKVFIGTSARYIPAWTTITG